MQEKIKAPYFDGTQPCAQVGGDFFFPDNAAEMGAIKPFIVKLCDSCEFKKACLAYAMKYDVVGFWAGTSYRQRELTRKASGLKVTRLDAIRYRTPQPAPSYELIDTAAPIYEDAVDRDEFDEDYF